MKKIEREAEYIASREPDKEARYYFGQIKDILNLIKAKQLPDGRFSDDEVCLFEEICHAFSIRMEEQTVEIKQKAVNSDQEGDSNRIYIMVRRRAFCSKVIRRIIK